jgi:hypothetical protein
MLPTAGSGRPTRVFGRSKVAARCRRPSEDGTADKKLPASHYRLLCRCRIDVGNWPTAGHEHKGTLDLPEEFRPWYLSELNVPAETSEVARGSARMRSPLVRRPAEALFGQPEQAY